MLRWSGSKLTKCRDLTTGVAFALFRPGLNSGKGVQTECTIESLFPERSMQLAHLASGRFSAYSLSGVFLGVLELLVDQFRVEALVL